MRDIIQYYMKRFNKSEVKDIKGGYSKFWNYSFLIYNNGDKYGKWITRWGCCTEIQDMPVGE